MTPSNLDQLRIERQDETPSRGPWRRKARLITAALNSPSGVTSSASMASTAAAITACMRPRITQLAKAFTRVSL